MIEQFCLIFDKPLTQAAVLAEAWYSVLAEVPMRHVAAAARELLKSAKWMPRPAEVYEAAVLLWRKQLTVDEIAGRQRLTHKPGKPMTREELREIAAEIGRPLKGIDETDRERERKRRLAQAHVEATC